MKTIGLYIHIPFCKQKCLYCDFFSYSNYDSDMLEKYLDYVIKELEIRLVKNKDKTIDTVYIGGGTPSALSSYLYETFFKKLFSLIDENKIKEITFEANPESVNIELVSFLSQFKNIRISLGVQTINDKSLEKIGRIAKIKDINNSFDILGKSDIKNVSSDFILGLPYSDENTSINDIAYILDLSKKCNVSLCHISLYFLELSEKEHLAYSWKSILPKEYTVIEAYYKTLAYLYENNFKRYEISNYTLGGEYMSKHNMHYWNMDEYIGSGVSASGFYNNIRYKNTNDIKKYFSSLDNNILNIDFEENITGDIYKKEYIFLSLRKTECINIALYKNKFGEDFILKFHNIIKKYEAYFNITDTNISFTDEGMLYTNEIVSSLFLYL